jgi:hypothetical protein
MITTEQKNINILNRFETKESESPFKRFNIKFTDGRGAIMLCSNGETFEESKKSAMSIFGKLFLSIE